MPLSDIRTINDHTLLGFWHLTELPEELLPLLPPQLPQERLQQLKTPKRQTEWLGSRLLAYELLKKFTDAPLVLQNNALGKPVFDKPAFRVSISHSPELAVVILSDKYEVGTDIEFIRPKIGLLAEKFLSETEKTDAGTDISKISVYWSAKETLYKLYSRKQLIFKEQLLVKPFELKEKGALEGQVLADDFNQKFTLQYEHLSNHILTYSFSEK